MKLAIELEDINASGYGVIHRSGCRDLRDPETLGDAATRAEANALASDLTGWEDDEYKFAPCVRLP